MQLHRFWWIPVFFAISVNLKAQKTIFQPLYEAALSDPATVFLLPFLNNDSLMQAEQSQRRPGRPHYFAHPFTTDLSPENAGGWYRLQNGDLVWSLSIRSPNARSLNLGFDQFLLPPSANLYLYSGDFNTRIGPLTAHDNEEHLAWWSPMIAGKVLHLQLRVKSAELPQLRLRLRRINHDFANFATTNTDNCFLDTGCGTEDGWTIVEKYKDQIRSVVLITIEGIRACTAFLINNTAKDCRPFLMSAFHCDITPETAPGIVAYWNFEHSDCRQINTEANSGTGDGSLITNNSGAYFRAGKEDTDMLLIELDDEPATNEVFFAGWDRNQNPPQDTVVGIHHPNGLEKRISFAFTDTYTSDWESYNQYKPDGDHLIVPRWSVGSTAPASSGSPLFDKYGLVRAQLHGGLASCDKQSFDSYGRFAAAWNAGADSSESLQYWLDPLGTDVLTLPGKNYDYCGATLRAFPARAEICPGDTVIFGLEQNDFHQLKTETTIFSLSGGLQAWIDGPETLIVAAPKTSMPGTYYVGIYAQNTYELAQITIEVQVLPQPNPATLYIPLPGSIIIGKIPDFSWNGSGEFQLSSDPDFDKPILVHNSSDNNLQPASLPAYGHYYWRIKTDTDCGFALSEVFDFYYYPDAGLRFDGAKILLRPNPVSETIHISLSRPLNQSVELTLFQANGALVHRQNLSAGAYLYTVEVGHLPNGFYILQLRRGTSQFVQKILLQKP